MTTALRTVPNGFGVKNHSETTHFPSWNVAPASGAEALVDGSGHIPEASQAKDQGMSAASRENTPSDNGPGLGAFLTALMYGE
jgi:hypothetical protein